MIRALAFRYSTLGRPKDDLIQAARLGAFRALERYDGRPGVAFTTFAHRHIRGALQHHLRDEGRGPIAEPAWLQEARHTCAGPQARLRDELGRSPTAEELWRAAPSLSLETVTLVLETEDVFTVSPLGSGDDDDPDTYDIERYGLEPDFAPASDTRHVLESVISRIANPHQCAIRLVYLEGCNKAEASRRLGVAPPTVDDWVTAGLSMMRSILLSMGLGAAELAA